MSVLLVSNSLPTGTGGLASYERALAKLLVHNANPVRFVASSIRHSGLDVQQQIDGTESHLVDSCMLGIATGQLGRSLASRAMGQPLIDALLRVVGNYSLSRYQKWNPTAVHYIGTGWSMTGFAWAQFARRCGVAFTVMPAVHAGRWGDDAIDIRLYNQSDAVLCLSDFEREHLRVRGVDSTRLRRCLLPPMCMANGDGNRMRAKLELGSRPVVLFIGRRDEGKGYVPLLEAWAQVVKQKPDAVLLLAGPGGGWDEVLRRIPPRNIVDLGVPDEHVKADALAACDIFCLPSEHESFGIVYVEAWSYGKPVICGTAPACRELVQDGHTGLHASQDTAELATALIDLLSDEVKARAMGACGRAQQQERFTPQAMLDSHLHAWNQTSTC